MALAVALALGDLGVWSLVVAEVVSAVVSLAGVLLLAPYRVRPRFDRADARAALADSRGFLAQGGLAFIQANVDYLAVGRALGPRQLGLYSLAYRLGEIPYWAIANPIVNVSFPGIARMRHRGEDVVPAFLTSLRVVALIACPLGILLSAAADPFTQLVLGARWAEAVGPLTVLGIWAAVRVVQELTAWLLNSMGEAALLARISASALIVLVPAVLLAANLGGITAVAWVVLADSCGALLALAFFAGRRLGVPTGRLWNALAPIALGCTFCWAAARAVVYLVPAPARPFSLVAATAVGAAVYIATVRAIAPELLVSTSRFIRAVLGRPAPAPELS